MNTQCIAIINRKTGRRCPHWAAEGHTTCRFHGGKTGRKAREAEPGQGGLTGLGTLVAVARQAAESATDTANTISALDQAIWSSDDPGVKGISEKFTNEAAINSRAVTVLVAKAVRALESLGFVPEGLVSIAARTKRVPEADLAVVQGGKVSLTLGGDKDQLFSALEQSGGSLMLTTTTELQGRDCQVEVRVQLSRQSFGAQPVEGESEVGTGEAVRAQEYGVLKDRSYVRGMLDSEYQDLLQALDGGDQEQVLAAADDLAKTINQVKSDMRNGVLVPNGGSTSTQVTPAQDEGTEQEALEMELPEEFSDAVPE